MAGRLLQQLLVASLTGAVTLIQMYDIPVLIRHQLHLDVLRLNDEFFHIDGVIPKICTGLRFRRIKGIRKLFGTIRTAHSASASSAACLDQHRGNSSCCSCMIFMRKSCRTRNMATRFAWIMHCINILIYLSIEAVQLAGDTDLS